MAGAGAILRSPGAVPTPFMDLFLSDGTALIVVVKQLAFPTTVPQANGAERRIKSACHPAEYRTGASQKSLQPRPPSLSFDGARGKEEDCRRFNSPIPLPDQQPVSNRRTFDRAWTSPYRA